MSLGSGVTGTPSVTLTCTAGDTVNYTYSLQSGYTSLVVTLDGTPVAASGTVIMNRAHTLVVSATPVSTSSLTVTITGLSSLNADVTITGPSNYSHHLTATETLTGLMDGTYTLIAATVTDTTQPGLGRGNSGTLGPVNLQRHPYRPVQTVTVSSGAGTATVLYPAATLTVQIPKAGLTGTVPMDFVLVPAGSFTMGSAATGDNYGLVATPAHTVTISEAFYVAKTHITQAQWKSVMGATNNPSWFSGDTLPMETVSWDAIRTPTTGFLAQLQRAFAGYGFRLPSEAEYEYACRAGTTTAYFFGTDSTTLSTYANGSGVSTSPVASFAPNPWGLYDIIGNVWHWVEDDVHSGYTSAPVDGSAWVDTPVRGSYRVLRGGSWIMGGGSCRSATRVGSTQGNHGSDIGFRVVLPVSGTL
jgi:formylglycine-generating enzyme required for sulfatase activity